MSPQHSYVRVRAPATTANLGPGFDVLGMALSLWNEVEVRPATRWSVRVVGEGQGVLPQDEENLVCRAMRALAAFVGQELPPLEVLCHNRIPLQSGLGSSSAAIVSGLLAAQHLLAAPLSPSDLLALATRLEGHPDNVAPALLGGLVAVTMVDERPVAVSVSVPRDLRVIVVLPDVRVSTEMARRLLPEQLPREDAVFNVGRVVLTVLALSRGDFELLSVAMADKLHEPYRKRLIPAYEAVVAAARQAGAAAVVISGSGPALAAFAAEGHDRIAQAMTAAFEHAGVRARSWVLSVATGASLISDTGT